LNGRSVGGPVLEIGEGERGFEDLGKDETIVEGDGHSSCKTTTGSEQ